MTPPSQRFRQIGFALDGGPGELLRFDLAIRPEDLTIAEMSRLTVQQTLGGAWADSFDRGLATITLSGTLGWRGSLLLSGEDAFKQLHDTLVLEWHQRRRDAIGQGTDPTEVQLTFIDTLDDATFIVAPQQFSLRRSRSAPLLMRYQIRLLALADADAPSGLLDQISRALSNPLRWLAGVTGLGGVVSTLQGYLTTGLNLYGAARAAVDGFVGTAVGVLSAVRDVAQFARGAFSGPDAQLLSAARMIASAGAGAFAALSTDPGLPKYLLIPALRLSAAFVDAECNMANSFITGTQFTTYDDLFGASSCSSTGGGDPINKYTAAGLNPIADIFPVNTPRVQVSAEGVAALVSLARDPLALVGQDAYTVGQLQIASRGITVR